MVVNPRANELEEKEKVEYEWGTLWPKYHKSRMNWASGFRTKGDVDILFLSGSTGRDPFEDTTRYDASYVYDKKSGKRGKVVGGLREQTRQALMDIKDTLEMMGASMKNIIMFRWFLVDGQDVFEMRNEAYRFYKEFAPELLEHFRPGTFIKVAGLDLPEMLIEVEAWAVVPRKGARKKS